MTKVNKTVKTRRNELRELKPDSLLYGLCHSAMAGDREELNMILNVLQEKAKVGQILEPGDIIGVIATLYDELDEHGILDDFFEDDDDFDEDLEDEEICPDCGGYMSDHDEEEVEFPLETYPDEDPKKRLN